jgi:hypothetical protein
VIKAIETKYKGYRFRSRLEARWAIFFDSLHLRWSYETEGFVLQDGRGYLPDFFLHDLGLFVEIKPTRKGLEKYYLFSEQRGAIALIGEPGSNDSYYGIVRNDEPYFWCICPSCRTIGIEFDGRAARLKHTKDCEVLLYKSLLFTYYKQYSTKMPVMPVVSGTPLDKEARNKVLLDYEKACKNFWKNNAAPILQSLADRYGHEDKIYACDDPIILVAHSSARSVRFEFGETPLCA